VAGFWGFGDRALEESAGVAVAAMLGTDGERGDVQLVGD
jgi:hypothetical protein